jgi:WD40 repeat protein
MAGIEAWNTSELLAACCGTTVKVWSPAAAEPRHEVKLSEGADVHALDWSGNNKVLAIAGDKPQITMVGGGKVIGCVPEGVEPGLAGISAIKFSGDSKKLVVGCANRALHVRDLRSQVRGAEGRLAASRGGVGPRPRSGGLGPWMIQTWGAATRLHAVRMLQPAVVGTATPMPPLPQTPPRQGAGNKHITDHRGAVCAVAISPDDGLIASSRLVSRRLCGGVCGWLLVAVGGSLVRCTAMPRFQACLSFISLSFSCASFRP